MGATFISIEFIYSRTRQAFGLLFVAIGSWLVISAGKRAANVFLGKPVIEETVCLSLPGRATCKLTMPKQISSGRAIVFFDRTREKFTGKVTLQKIPIDRSPAPEAELPKVEPIRMKVPKWSPTSDAGQTHECWRKGTGQSNDPVILKFGFPIEAGQKIQLNFDLASNFQGTLMERRFPVTGEEKILIIVKAVALPSLHSRACKIIRPILRLIAAPAQDS